MRGASRRGEQASAARGPRGRFRGANGRGIHLVEASAIGVRRKTRSEQVRCDPPGGPGRTPYGRRSKAIEGTRSANARSGRVSVSETTDLNGSTSRRSDGQRHARTPRRRARRAADRPRGTIRKTNRSRRFTRSSVSDAPSEEETTRKAKESQRDEAGYDATQGQEVDLIVLYFIHTAIACHSVCGLS